MASRQLRKLRQKQEALNLQPEPAVKDEESEDEPVVAKPRPNMFSGFAALGDMDDDNDNEEDEEKDEEKDEDQNTDDEKLAPKDVNSQAEPAKKSKKSKKKKKKKGKQADTTAAPTKKEPEPEDDIDRVLAELKLQDNKKGDSSSAATATQAATYEEDRLAKLLSINFQHLKYMNEMRRLFGKAMDVAEGEERTQGTQQQRHIPEDVDLETYLSARAAQGQQAKSGMFETVLRTNPFIEGKKNWPRGASQGLKMVRIGDQGKAGVVEFAFAHDKAYDELEGNFFGLVQMYDPMQIVNFLHQHPYHVSSLIQVSKVARQDQNTALAADLIDRALFTFGRVGLSEFRKKLEQGKARLDFNRPENRQFWLAGWNLIQKLTLKGTYRTALEWTKLLLSISADDPYSLINWIHVLAIRAREAQWFIDLCYSPLFRLNHLQSPINYMRQTLPLAYLQLDDAANAKSHLIDGIESFPWLYCALCSALNIDTPKSIWGLMPRDEDETLHTELYIHMAKDLWNTPAAISLLKEAAAAANPPKDVKNLPPGPSVSLATARFVYLDNAPSLLTLVPRGMIHNASPNYDFDPLPPMKANNIFSSETQKRPWNSQRPTGTEYDGMRAAAQRLLEHVPPEELEQALREEGFGGGLWDFLMRLRPDAPPIIAARNNPGVGGERQAREPHQAFVEDAEDDGDDNWQDAEEDHDLEDEDDDLGDGGQEQGHGRGGNWADMAGQMPRRIWEAIAGPALNSEFAQVGGMPGSWRDDSEGEYGYAREGEEGQTTDEDMPGLENPGADDSPAAEDPNART